MAIATFLAWRAPAAAQSCVSDSSDERSRCNIFWAVQSGDERYCDRLEGDFERADCYAAVARTSGVADCSALGQDQGRVECRQQVRVGDALLQERQAAAAAEAEEVARQEEALLQQREQLEAQAAELEQEQEAQAELADALSRQAVLQEQQIVEQRRLREVLQPPAAGGDLPAEEEPAIAPPTPVIDQE